LKKRDELAIEGLGVSDIDQSSIDPISGSDGAVLTRQHIEYPAGRWGNPAILGIANDLEQSAGSFAALRRHDAEFGQIADPPSCLGDVGFGPILLQKSAIPMVRLRRRFSGTVFLSRRV
jgi:hypothetical protein